MSATELEKRLGKQLMSAVIHPTTGMLFTSQLKEFEEALSRLGFQKIRDEAYGPAGGRQLFFRNGRVVARLKTKGDPQGFRENQPHFSVALTDGAGLDWFNELAKFNRNGDLAAKAMSPAERFRPLDFQGNPQRFVVIMGGQYDGLGADAWASRTHFTFPGNIVVE